MSGKGRETSFRLFSKRAERRSHDSRVTPFASVCFLLWLHVIHSRKRNLWHTRAFVELTLNIYRLNKAFQIGKCVERKNFFLNGLCQLSNSLSVFNNQCRICLSRILSGAAYSVKEALPPQKIKCTSEMDIACK